MTKIQYGLVDNHAHNYSDQYIYCKSCSYRVSLWTNTLEKAISILESSKDIKNIMTLQKEILIIKLAQSEIIGA